MKSVIGLDIGTNSIGWAFVKEAETPEEKSEIVKLGVRIIPITTEEEKEFLKGKAISTNQKRTQKRSSRRTKYRYKLRRAELIKILKEHGFINDSTILAEEGKQSTYSTLKVRAKAATNKVTKEEFAKVLLMINKKRGYKSIRKIKIQDEDGTNIDNIEIARYLYNNNLTPGQYAYNILKSGKKYIPDFYKSDLLDEFNKIWDYQKQFYPDILTDELKNQIKGKNKKETWKLCEKAFRVKGLQLKGTLTEKRFKQYEWRYFSLKEKIDLEKLTVLLQEINSQIIKSSGYLSEMSDRNKYLFLNKLTVGQFLLKQLQDNPMTSTKNQVFYRQDYLDEFETIWQRQQQYYPELTNELKKQIRDKIIFYQRPLKSQKALLNYCEFESWEVEYIDKETKKKKKRTVGHKVIPKSSPLFQEFKIWQILNNIEIINIETGEITKLDQDTKDYAFRYLNIIDKISAKDFIKLIVKDTKNYEVKNYTEIEGNKTNAELYKIYKQILDFEGIELNFNKLSIDEINKKIRNVFNRLNISTEILTFHSEIGNDDFDKQPIMQLWHLLYSFSGDKSITGNQKLIQKLESKFGFKKEYAKLIANISLQDGYGSLSSRAIRKILPFLKKGNTYDQACMLAGYNHSSSLTTEEKNKISLQNKLELLPKNSLRNPIVEKILNQLVNLINAILEDESLGKPDEIRIELARELKKSAAERKKMTEEIFKATKTNEEIRKILIKDFGLKKVSRNDIIKYKLWKELEMFGYKTLYTQTKISEEELFTNKFDIDHIIPQSKLFDDSFSNKTLALKDINIDKGNNTAFDYLKNKLSEDDFRDYLSRVERLYNKGVISKSKFLKLKMKDSDIPDDFIERDLRNSQYIARKAIQMLNKIAKTVTPTTGMITNRLRDDWQLINLLKELNLPKFEKLGLVHTFNGNNGKHEKIIEGWTKRNDHRHHAVDALTVAFTKPAFIQYLNNLNARNNKSGIIYGIEKKYLYRNDKNKLLFKPPMEIGIFRKEAKKHLENILVSYKTKNKVVTKNKNKIKVKGKNNYKIKIELTPRGELHKETVYGKIKKYKTKFEKINTSFDFEKINLVANTKYKTALLKRLQLFNGNPRKAFGGKNSPKNNPIFIDENKTLKLPEKVKLVWFEEQYVIKKELDPDLKIEKVIDPRVKSILTQRLNQYNGNKKKAFANLDENPIWFNKNKGIDIKRVRITGVQNAIPLHDKKDHRGNYILDENGVKIPVDYVNTGNNHHVAIYRDENGKLQEEVVSFFEAVIRIREGLPVVNKNKNNWEFLFTMKQNECFVFPSDDFDPSEIDLLDPRNSIIISPHLFRVQKISSKNYVFNHHLQTKAVDNDLLKNHKELKGITYHFIQTPSKLEGIVKVRINHLGKIVHVGEY